MLRFASNFSKLAIARISLIILVLTKDSLAAVSPALRLIARTSMRSDHSSEFSSKFGSVFSSEQFSRKLFLQKVHPNEALNVFIKLENLKIQYSCSPSSFGRDHRPATIIRRPSASEHQPSNISGRQPVNIIQIE